METAAATRAPRRACAHCGLPVADPGTPDSAELFCCHACRMVAAIIGRQQGEQSWDLLRLGFGTLLAMNIMMISLLLYTGSVETDTVPVFRHLLLGLATPALAILLPPFLAGATKEFDARHMSLDALIACGSLAAFFVSAVNAVRGAGEIYFDTATMLPVLVTLGKIIEAGAKTRAADLLHSLESLLPDTALLVTATGSAEVAIGELRAGDLIRVRPGERVAVDGHIREGSSSIAEAAFTGEFLPRLCRRGDRVVAGTINGAGTMVVQADRTGADLLLHGVIAQIDAAWRTPSRAERIAERAATLFFPALLFVAAGSVFCWWMLGNLGQGMLSALSVLVVACPCTMGIATPLATSLAIARAAKAGIVVRGGSVMEQMAGTDLVFFDKTGTLTVGYPALREIRNLDGTTGQGELLGRLAALELAGGHPLGRAVLAEASRRGCEAGAVAQVRVYPGSGIAGAVTWQGCTKLVTAGAEHFVRESLPAAPTKGDCPGNGSSPAEGPYRAGCSAAGRHTHEDESPRGDDPGTKATPGDESPGDGGCTVIDVAWEGKLRGRLLLADTVRSDAPACIQALSGQGIATVLLSGDRLPAAAAIAARVGITRVEAPRTPAQKLQAIADGIASGSMVAMVGDGINDAPALAAAHTGIAMGAGMDLAKQAGNVVLVSGRLTQIPWLFALSRRTATIIRGNFAWSFGYNAIAIGAAAAGLLHPLLAALAMVVSSISVLGNSLRIMAFPEETDPIPPASKGGESV